jgi:hypothetical protein
MAEELFADFLDPHFRFFHLANDEPVNFLARLIDQALALVNGLLIHFDKQAADELIVIEFDEVFFYLPNFDIEFHKRYVPAGFN